MSTTSYRTLLATLQHGAQNTLCTSAEVDAVVDAAEQLAAHHYRRFTSTWYIPQLLSCVLRVQLNARLTDAGTTRTPPPSCLLHVFVACWRMCPLAALPPPTDPFRLASTPEAALSLSITRDDMERVAAEFSALQELCDSAAPSPLGKTSPDVYRTALSLVMALLTYWHLIAAEEDADEDERDKDEGFYCVSETVWNCVHRWTNTAASAEACAVAIRTWMHTVLRRALRYRRPVPLLQLVEWLEGFLSSSVSLYLSDQGVKASPSVNAALDACWARLHSHLFQHVSIQLHTCQTRLKTRWTAAVTPVLTQALAQEPPLLSGSSLQCVDFGTCLEVSLGALVNEVAQFSCQCDASSSSSSLAVTTQLLSPLLQLATLQRHVKATSLHLTSFFTKSTYQMYLRPVVAVCLRWGLIDAAQTLLEWAADGLDDHGKAWLRRLQSYCMKSAPMFERESAASVGDDRDVQAAAVAVDGCRYSSWMEHKLCSSQAWLTAPQALDAIVCGGDVYRLRLVCDALLRFTSSWGLQVLTDPFAAYFILRSLAQLASYFLDVGDAPLARYYLALHGQLLPRYLCPTSLGDFLCLLRRCANSLSNYHLSPFGSSTAASEHGKSVAQWRSVRECLSTMSLPLPAEAVNDRRCGATPRMYVSGMAWTARRRFQAHCAAVRPGPLPCDNTHVSAATDKGMESRRELHGSVVAAHYTPHNGGTLWLQGGVFDGSAATDEDARELHKAEMLSYAVCCVSVEKELRSCVAEMAEIVQSNREQLLRGSSSCAMADEKALCADSCEGVPSAPCSAELAGTHATKKTLEAVCAVDNPIDAHRRQKEEWWCARYALDVRISSVVASLETALGARRVLLAGRPSRELTSTLSTTAMTFAAQCLELRRGQACPSVSALQLATTTVLLASPYLWSTSQSDPTAQPVCLYCPSDHSTCLACAATVGKAHHTLLHSIVDLGQSVVPADTLASRLPAANTGGSNSDDAWVSLLLDTRVVALVNELAKAALDAYYRACAACTTQTAPAPPHFHLDLLLLPREHTYLVLDGELHGLPWEGLDVCRDRSTSRVPSLDYLQRASSSLCATAVSLQRTLVYRDCDAIESRSGLTDLLASRPSWEVVYGDTRGPAAAAQTSGVPTSTSPSPLLQRVAGPPRDGDHLDAYVYGGHKGGEQLLSRASLYEYIPPSLSTQPSLVLLMGCSSARTFGNALCDSFGLPFAYLSAGLSCMVGCLWDVTDGDVDRLTCRLLGVATEATSGVATVGEALAVARRACKLRCLTGLSTVFYGLNLPLEKEKRK